MRNAMRQRVGLAGAGAGQDQERPGGAEIRPAVFDGTTLLGIELNEVSGGHRCMRTRHRTTGDSPVSTVGPMPAAPRDSDGTTRTRSEERRVGKEGEVW